MTYTTLELSTTQVQTWSLSKKIVFRFVGLYFLFYIFFWPNTRIELITTIYEWINTGLHQFIPWIGESVLHLDAKITTFTNGSGDTTYDYVLLLFNGFLVSIGTIIWSVADRKQPNYNKLLYWLTVLLRYYLFYQMLRYGLSKIFKLQFPFSSPYGLMKTYGESSPMNLAWTFMGYSYAYNVFAGLMELIGGVFLLWRRTITLGALAIIIVMINVVAMNFCFDICVKLLSSHMLLMALFLLLLDRERLFNVFLGNKPTHAIIPNVVFTNLRFRRIQLFLKLGVVGFLVYATLMNMWARFEQQNDWKPKPVVYGVYNIETYVMNQDTVPPLLTDTIRWRQLMIGYRGVGLKMMNDSIRIFSIERDTLRKKMTLTGLEDTSAKYTFIYSLPDKEHLVLRGNQKKDSVIIHLKSYDLNRFSLVNRGFHWINEYPFNR